jgi:hypothetical protein
MKTARFVSHSYLKVAERMLSVSQLVSAMRNVRPELTVVLKAFVSRHPSPRVPEQPTAMLVRLRLPERLSADSVRQIQPPVI